MLHMPVTDRKNKAESTNSATLAEHEQQNQLVNLSGKFSPTRDRSNLAMMQQAYGNQAALRRLRTEKGRSPAANPLQKGVLQRKCACGNSAGSSGSCTECQSKQEGILQTKLQIGKAGDEYEREADRVAEQVMSMAPVSTPTVQGQGEEVEPEDIQTKPLAETIMPLVQRQELLEEDEPIQAKCETCEQENPIQRAADGVPQAQPDLESRLNASKGGGSPLPNEVRSFMEPRFGTDFSHVRVHTDGKAVQMNRELGARAFTHGSHIYYGARNAPAKDELTGHELTHVVQQGGVPSIQHRSANENSGQRVPSNELYRGMSGCVVQRLPGDGMVPPGDCSWAKYLVLRGSVETAKAVVSNLGACSAGDSCLFLAAKIASISAEIVARVSLDTTCFKGGDTGHRQQVQDKINMMNRCYRFFSISNCSPELIVAMAVVVEQARAVIAATAVVVAVALVVALIAAIIALAEVIAAAAAAAAAGAVIGVTVAAVIVLLVTIKEGLSSEES